MQSTTASAGNSPSAASALSTWPTLRLLVVGSERSQPSSGGRPVGRTGEVTNCRTPAPRCSDSQSARSSCSAGASSGRMTSTESIAFAAAAAFALEFAAALVALASIAALAALAALSTRKGAARRVTRSRAIALKPAATSAQVINAEIMRPPPKETCSGDASSVEKPANSRAGRGLRVPQNERRRSRDLPEAGSHSRHPPNRRAMKSLEVGHFTHRRCGR